MNKQRLLILAKHLDKHVEPQEFNLSYWRYDEAQCGTVACACGHAASVPAFKELGFRLEDRTNYLGTDYTIRFGNYRGWKAVEAFFGLNDKDSIYLFSASRYEGLPGPKEVAARIEEFVKRSESGA
jgi:hypothetical protein